MRAHKTKTIYFYCTKCRERAELAPGTWVCVLGGASIGYLRNNFPRHTDGVPDDSFGEVDDEGERYIRCVSLNCANCDRPVAKWNEYLDETTEVKASQIENYPLNQSRIDRLWECGDCQSQHWEAESAEECCI